MKQFENQTVIITGGTRGLGAGMARAFLEEGAYVIATYAGNDQAAQEFKASLHEKGEKLELRKFDVSNGDEVKTFWDSLEEQNKDIQILVNNGGIRKDQVTAMLSEDDWDRVMDVNAKGSFLMAKHAVKAMMRNRFGRIINISSIAARMGLPGQANYSASKAAQIALSSTLSKECGKKGITVNCVCPGFIETEMTATLDESLKKEYAKQVPLKRFGTVDEVAAAVKFLASKEASYISGSVIEVAGGL